MAGILRASLLAAGLALAGCGPGASPPPEEGPRVADLLGGDADRFERALPGGTLAFPADHGAHPDYRSEWWYFTGNLATREGRHFGFQLTFFRFALSPDEPARDSAWASRQIWMAHLAVSDPAAGRFSFRERLSRGALGLAGARTLPLAVWLDDWRLESTADEFLPLRLVARDDGVALDLTLDPGKPRVLQGQDGLSAKGPEPGNASWYYAYTRLPAAGRIELEGEAFEVTGLAWLDREWGTSALGPGVEGWDWFALQLDDGAELMVYRLRRADGTAAADSAGSLVAADGGILRLGSADFELAPTRLWTSPASGVTYPVAWTVNVPSAGLELRVEPWQDDQEMNVSVRYWEGAIRVRGTRDGRPVGGNGYLELAGYRRPGASPERARPPR
jgi:predicted secreted hydrolase